MAKNYKDRTPDLARCPAHRVHPQNTPADECVVEVLWMPYTVGRDGVLKRDHRAHVRCLFTRETATVPLSVLVSL